VNIPKLLYAVLATVAFQAASAGSVTPPSGRTLANADAASSAQPKTGAAGAAEDVEDPAYAAEGEHLGEVAGAHLIGQPAPPVTVTTIDGEKIDLGALYGKKPVYLKFWATWCVPCRQQMPGFEKIYESLGDRVQIIAIDIGLSDDEASVRAYRKKFGLRMPIVIDDGLLGALFNLRVTPQHVVIGRDGRFEYMGHLADQRVDMALQKSLSEPASTPSAVGQLAANKPAFKVGDVIRGLDAKTTTGSHVSLGRRRDQRLLGLVFFSTWCESYLETSRPQTSKACRRDRVEVDRLAHDAGVSWLGIAGGLWSTAENVKEYQSTTKIKIPLALDQSGSLFRSFGVRDIPTIALIDSSGRVVRVLGPDDADISGAIRAARAGPSVAHR
jgi:thiol-disulfide isomerase/thioredoxin